MSTHIIIDRWFDGEELHLDLKGHLDGSSAFQVIDAIKDENRNFTAVSINTDLLTGIEPFGVAVFKTNLAFFNRKRAPIMFVGRYASDL